MVDKYPMSGYGRVMVIRMNPEMLRVSEVIMLSLTTVRPEADYISFLCLNFITCKTDDSNLAHTGLS